VDESTAPRAQEEPEQPPHGGAEPQVDTTLDGGVATIAVAGELTGAARRPLVRAMTDLLLAEHALRQVRLDTRGVTYLNSAGMAVLVQLLKLAQPRGVDLVLVTPPSAVSRPLQLSGLWLRFAVEERPPGE
jgi:stage II sporulation protein AA (anti-sigma F factor antagonist)